MLKYKMGLRFTVHVIPLSIVNKMSKALHELFNIDKWNKCLQYSNVQVRLNVCLVGYI